MMNILLKSLDVVASGLQYKNKNGKSEYNSVSLHITYINIILQTKFPILCLFFIIISIYSFLYTKSVKRVRCHIAPCSIISQSMLCKACFH